MITTLPILTQGDNWFMVFDDIGRKYPNIAGDVFLLFMQADGARDIPSCIYDAGMRYKARLVGRRTKAEFVSFDDERDVDVYDDSHADILKALTAEDNRACRFSNGLKQNSQTILNISKSRLRWRKVAQLKNRATM